jgi:hypothetical protein
MASASETPVTLSVPPPHRFVHETEDEQGRLYLLIGLSPEMNLRIDKLAVNANVSKSEIINRAIGLYKAATDAIAEGKRVGVVNDPNIELDTEFVDL